MNTTPSRLVMAALATGVTLTLIAGCSSDDGDTATSSATPTELAPAQQWDPNDPPRSTGPTAPTAETSLPEKAARVDRTDPELVAQAAVQVWFSWDTGTDDGPNDATARTAPLLTQEFADSLLSTGSNSPGGQWLTWAEQDAIITPTWRLMPDQGAPQNADRRYFVYEVTQTARTPEGDLIGTPVVTSAWVICVRHGNNWEVSQLAQR